MPFDICFFFPVAAVSPARNGTAIRETTSEPYCPLARLVFGVGSAHAKKLLILKFSFDASVLHLRLPVTGTSPPHESHRVAGNLSTTSANV
jgi:hypothetical protein